MEDDSLISWTGGNLPGRGWSLIFVAVVIAVGARAQVAAQEGMAPAARRPGRGTTRDFLGLGPAPDAVAAKKGQPLYEQNCAACHGEKARGSQGPNLVRSVVVLHDENDEAIGPVIHAGRPQAGMPAFPQLSKDDIHNISQFLKLQVEAAANRGGYQQLYGNVRSQTSGDAEKGREFFEANCGGCHSATGDLAKIGAKFPVAAEMQARFLWPANRGEARVTVTTADGRRIEGAVVKLDDFDVAVRDGGGEYHSWPREAVKVEAEDKLGGHRALLPKYTDADMHNVTAYLETLK